MQVGRGPSEVLLLCLQSAGHLVPWRSLNTGRKVNLKLHYAPCFPVLGFQRMECKIYKDKAIPVTGREGPEGCETSRLPHFLDNRRTHGGEVVSLTHRPPFTPRKIPGTHFRYRLSRPQGHSAAGKIRSIEKSNDIGNRTGDLPACIVPQPTTLPRARGVSSLVGIMHFF
jgi:hypothetical protein